MHNPRLKRALDSIVSGKIMSLTRLDTSKHHPTMKLGPHPKISESYAAGIREGMERAAERVAYDENRKLDEYYCCSAMSGTEQICGCCAVSIREELSAAIRALAYT